MVKFEDLFSKRINEIIGLYQDFMLFNKEQFTENGKNLASRIEVKLYELRQKASDFDKIRNNQKNNNRQQRKEKN